MSAAINNDVVAAAAGAAVTYACVRLMADERGLRWQWGVWLGALYALALMSKFNLAAIIVVIEAAVTWVAWRRGQWRQWFVVNALLVGVTALLAGWWFVRNQMLYGEPTGFEQLTELWGVRDPRESFGLAISELPYAWTSLWGRFGYGQIPLPPVIYIGLFVVLLMSIGGYLFALLSRLRPPLPLGEGSVPPAMDDGRQTTDDRTQSADDSSLVTRHSSIVTSDDAGDPNRPVAPLPPGSPAPLRSSSLVTRHSSLFWPLAPLLLLALNVAIFFAVLFNYLLVSPAGPMGRFFFPALPALGILMFYGLTLWQGPGSRGQGPGKRALALEPGPWNLEPGLAWLVTLGLITLSLVALFGYLAPAYARPETWNEGDALPNPVDIRFDTLARLRGYSVDTTTARPGEPIDVELYWEVTGQPPGDYLLFLHLVDSATGALVAQRDTHPGLGNFPSSQWRPGDRFVERLSLYVPETAYVPAAAELRAGLYAPGGFRLGLTDGATGEGLGDSFPLGTVALELGDAASPVPNPGDYRFEDRFRLVGYSYDRRALTPGEPLSVTLYWTAGPAAAEGYEVQLRLLDEAGNVVHHEQRPLPTLPPGEVVADTHLIPPDPARPPGSYTVQVAIEGPEDRRLQLVGEDGRWIDDKLRLAAVRQ
jgi:hypothetical protein